MEEHVRREVHDKAPEQTPAAKEQGLKNEQPADMVACTFRVEGKTELGEEVVVMRASKELREWDLEQSLVIKRELPSEIQDVWQLAEILREEFKRLEEETKQRFTVQIQVNHALTHLALSGHGGQIF